MFKVAANFWSKCHRKLIISSRWPRVFAAFWAYGDRSILNIKGVIGIFKFHLLYILWPIYLTIDLEKNNLFTLSHDASATEIKWIYLKALFRYA